MRASVSRPIARVNNNFVERPAPHQPSSRQCLCRIERPEQIRRMGAQKCYNVPSSPRFPEQRMSGDIMSLEGKVAMITVGNAVLFPALYETSYITGTALVVDDGCRGVEGGHTSCKRT